MRRQFLNVALLAAVATSVSCGDVGLLGPSGTGPISGNYQLYSLNGYGLPAILRQDAFERTDIVRDRLTLYSDGTYTDDYTIRTTTRNSSYLTDYYDTGWYERNGTAIRFYDDYSGAMFVGSLDGGRLTVTQFGDVYVFRR